MEINYVEHKDGTKLFSFHRHDYKTYGEGEDFIMIDGGVDYIRSSGNPQKDGISNLIKDIRKQFAWGKNYEKDGARLEKTQYILLRDITTDHIYGILKYFTEHTFMKDGRGIVSLEWKLKHLIFIEELIYRQNEQEKK